MHLVATLDDYGKPAWIAAMILGFIVWWPVGLGVLAYLIWSGRMGCGHNKTAWREYFTSEARRFGGGFGPGSTSGLNRILMTRCRSHGRDRSEGMKYRAKVAASSCRAATAGLSLAS